MRTTDNNVGLSWDFLETITRWTIGVAITASVIGVFATGRASFAVGCIVGAAGDIVLVRLAARRGSEALERGETESLSPAIMLGGRLLFKGLFLALALALPEFIDFAGAVVGILAFDLTLAFAGSALVAFRGLHDAKEDR